MMRNVLVSVLVLAIAGCATSTFNYTPPLVTTIDNQVVVAERFDDVWDRLVKNLASDFFVINNIDKNSRMINVSFPTNAPLEFISCGHSIREVSNARGEQKYEYDPASSARFTFTDKSGNVFLLYERLG